jgi:hypothetical protein
MKKARHETERRESRERSEIEREMRWQKETEMKGAKQKAWI